MTLSLQKKLGITDLREQVDELKRLTGSLVKRVEALESGPQSAKSKEEPTVKHKSASAFRRDVEAVL